MLAIASSYTFEEGEKEYVSLLDVPAFLTFFVSLLFCSHPADSIYIRQISDAEVQPKSKSAK